MKEVERTGNPSTYSVGSFVRVYRLPSKRERDSPPYWKKTMNDLVGEIGLVAKQLSSSSKQVTVVFRSKDQESSEYRTGSTKKMLKCLLEPVSDVDTQWQRDLQDLWRSYKKQEIDRRVAAAFRCHEVMQCQSFFGTAGSLVQVISRAPKKKSHKGVFWKNVKHTMSEYGIVCVGLDHGCTAVAFPEPIESTHFFPDTWLRRTSWSDIESQEQRNRLENLASIVVKVKKKRDEEETSSSSPSSSSSSHEDDDEDLRDIVKQLSLENVTLRKTTADLEQRLVLLEKKLESEQTLR